MKSDHGNVIVEFVGISVGMLVPIIFVASGAWSVAQAQFALRDAATSSARGFVQSDSVSDGSAKMKLIIADIAIQNGIDPRLIIQKITCSKSNCLTGGSQVTVNLDYAVKFSLPVFGDLTIPISDSHTEQVDEVK
jgi:hypothetical protein